MSCTSPLVCTAVGWFVDTNPVADSWNGTIWSPDTLPILLGDPGSLESSAACRAHPPAHAPQSARATQAAASRTPHRDQILVATPRKYEPHPRARPRSNPESGRWKDQRARQHAQPATPAVAQPQIRTLPVRRPRGHGTVTAASGRSQTSSRSRRGDLGLSWACPPVRGPQAPESGACSEQRPGLLGTSGRCPPLRQLEIVELKVELPVLAVA